MDIESNDTEHVITRMSFWKLLKILGRSTVFSRIWLRTEMDWKIHMIWTVSLIFQFKENRKFRPPSLEILECTHFFLPDFATSNLSRFLGHLNLVSVMPLLN